MQFDYKEEFEEFLVSGSIKSVEKISTDSHHQSILKLKTLEDQEFELQFGNEGILLLQKPEVYHDGQTKFDTIQGFLSTYSPLYRSKFSNDLFAKLAQLQ